MVCCCGALSVPSTPPRRRLRLRRVVVEDGAPETSRESSRSSNSGKSRAPASSRAGSAERGGATNKSDVVETATGHSTAGAGGAAGAASSTAGAASSAAASAAASAMICSAISAAASATRAPICASSAISASSAGSPSVVGTIGSTVGASDATSSAAGLSAFLAPRPLPHLRGFVPASVTAVPSSSRLARRPRFGLVEASSCAVASVPVLSGLFPASDACSASNCSTMCGAPRPAALSRRSPGTLMGRRYNWCGSTANSVGSRRWPWSGAALGRVLVVRCHHTRSLGLLDAPCSWYRTRVVGRVGDPASLVCVDRGFPVRLR